MKVNKLITSLALVTAFGTFASARINAAEVPNENLVSKFDTVDTKAKIGLTYDKTSGDVKHMYLKFGGFITADKYIESAEHGVIVLPGENTGLTDGVTPEELDGYIKDRYALTVENKIIDKVTDQEGKVTGYQYAWAINNIEINNLHNYTFNAALYEKIGNVVTIASVRTGNLISVIGDTCNDAQTPEYIKPILDKYVNTYKCTYNLYETWSSMFLGNYNNKQANDDIWVYSWDEKGNSWSKVTDQTFTINHNHNDAIIVAADNGKIPMFGNPNQNIKVQSQNLKFNGRFNYIGSQYDYDIISKTTVENQFGTAEDGTKLLKYLGLYDETNQDWITYREFTFEKETYYEMFLPRNAHVKFSTSDNPNNLWENHRESAKLVVLNNKLVDKITIRIDVLPDGHWMDPIAGRPQWDSSQVYDMYAYLWGGNPSFNQWVKVENNEFTSKFAFTGFRLAYIKRGLEVDWKTAIQQSRFDLYYTCDKDGNIKVVK